jgi:hypothetical protein
MVVYPGGELFLPYQAPMFPILPRGGHPKASAPAVLGFASIRFDE